MPPRLYLYLRRCHRCQRHRLESGGPHVPLSLMRPLPHPCTLLYLSQREGARVGLGRGQGLEGLGPSLSISPVGLPQ